MRWSIQRLVFVAALACFTISAPTECYKSAQPTSSVGHAVIVAQDKDDLSEMPWKCLKLFVRSGVYKDNLLLTRQEHSLPVIHAQKNETHIETSACHFISPSGPLSLCRGLEALLQFSRSSVHVISDASVSTFLRRRSFRRALVIINVTRILFHDQAEEEGGFLRRRRRSVPFQAATPYVVRLFLMVGAREDKKTLSLATDVINFVNAAYRELGLTFSVVALKFRGTWNGQLEAHEVLHEMSYERIKGVDCVHMLLPQSTLSAKEFVAGEVNVERMCGGKHCLGFTVADSRVGLTSLNAAFFLGRSLGLPEDTDPEDCQNCLMSNAPSRTIHWSRRSRRAMSELLGQGLARCLTAARGSGSPEMARCGNGLVEAPEECDCGPPDGYGCRANRCCLGGRCRRASWASCAAGRCCDLSRCALLSAGRQCRGARGPCDLAEFCNGTAERCPPDVHLSDGMPCSARGGVSAFCFAGECRSRASACETLWGETGREAPPACFVKNKDGSYLGDCGVQQFRGYDFPVKCPTGDMYCGRLWCSHRSEKSFAYGLIKERTVFLPRGGRCAAVAAVAAAGAVVGRDPGYVPNGAGCGWSHVCFNFSCVPLASLPDIRRCRCHGRGVCNSAGHCHCDYGYAPPDCRRSGTGGSIDSGAPAPRSMNALGLGAVVVFSILGVCGLLTACGLFLTHRYHPEPAAAPGGGTGRDCI